MAESREAVVKSMRRALVDCSKVAVEKVGALAPPPVTPERSTLKDWLNGATSVPSVASRMSVAAGL